MGVLLVLTLTLILELINVRVLHEESVVVEVKGVYCLARAQLVRAEKINLADYGFVADRHVVGSAALHHANTRPRDSAGGGGRAGDDDLGRFFVVLVLEVWNNL